MEQGTSIRVGKTGSKLGPGGYARNQILKDYKVSAQRRGLRWGLSDEDFDRLTSQPCVYCGVQPSTVAVRKKSTFTHNGIDRVDNDLGYVPENTVPCCEICNKAKRHLSYDDFMAWIARLTSYHFFHPDVMPSRLLRDASKAA